MFWICVKKKKEKKELISTTVYSYKQTQSECMYRTQTAGAKAYE